MDLLLASSTLLERTFFPLPGRAVCRHTPSPRQETTSPDSLWFTLESHCHSALPGIIWQLLSSPVFWSFSSSRSSLQTYGPILSAASWPWGQGGCKSTSTFTSSTPILAIQLLVSCGAHPTLLYQLPPRGMQHARGSVVPERGLPVWGICLHRVFVAACKIFSWGIRSLVPWPGI